MVDFQLVVMMALSIFGVTFTLYYLDGPWDILSRIRRRLSTTQQPVYDEVGTQVNIIDEPKEGSFFLGVLSCFWCSSAWVTIVIVGVYSLSVAFPFIDFVMLLLASYGLSGFMHEIIANG